MSDLHRAVQAEIAAHTPSLPPSFDALKARKRSRDRRRTAAAVAASALAVAGVAFLPAALAGGGGTAPAPVAQDGDDEVFGFGVKATDAEVATAEGGGGPEALQRCLELPGLSDVGAQYSYPGQYSGRVTGRGNAGALKSCVDAVPGWGITLTPVAGGQDIRTYTVRPSAKTVANARLEEERTACFTLPGVEAAQETSLDVKSSASWTYRVAVPIDRSEAFEQCITSVVGLYVPELDPRRMEAEGGKLVWTGAQVCKSGSEALGGPCRQVGPEEAALLDTVLDRAVPAPAGSVYCDALSTVYSVRFQHPSARPVPFEVPTGCGPVLKGTVPHLLDQAGRDQVARVFAGEAASEQPELTAAQQRLVDDCVGKENALPAPGYVGMTQEQAAPPDSLNPEPPRIVGRDGQCLGRDNDRRDSRVNLIVENGTVIWAGRF